MTVEAAHDERPQLHWSYTVIDPQPLPPFRMPLVHLGQSPRYTRGVRIGRVERVRHQIDA